MGEWYYQDSGREVGPLESGQIKHLFGQGAITRETLVRHPKTTDGAWRPMRELVDGQAGPRVIGTSPPPDPREPLPARIRKRWPALATSRSTLSIFSGLAGVGGFCSGIGAFFAMMSSGIGGPEAASGATAAVLFVGCPLLLVAGAAARVLGDLQLIAVTAETLLQEERERNRTS